MTTHDIDVATGSVAFDVPDVGLPGVLPLSFIRHYSTANLKERSELGLGWSHNFHHKLVKTLEGWQYTDERGSSTSLVGNVPGFRVVQDPQKVSLQRFTSGNPRLWMDFVRQYVSYLWLTPHQRLDIVRDQDELLYEVKHVRSRRELWFEYGEQLEKLIINFPAGKQQLVARYEYDVNQRLTKVYDLVGLREEYTYDELGCITKIKKRSGNEQVFEYDGQLRCIYTHGKDRFEERWMIYDVGTTKVIDRHHNETSYTYNRFGQVLKKIEPNGATTRWRYDDRGNLVSTIGPLGNRTEKIFDEFGRLVQIFKDKRVWVIEYDEEHKIKKITIPTNKTWSYEYDQYGVCKTVGPHGFIWRYQYNEQAELAKVIDPSGSVADRVYDHQGNIVETHLHGRLRKYEYDRYGRCTNEDGALRHYDEAGHLVRVDAGEISLQYTYDSQGKIVERKGPSGTWKIDRIPCGCPKTITRPDGSCVQLHWGNEPGQLLSIIDGEGKKISWTYDNVGRVVERKHWDGRTAKFEYDLAGNPIKVTDDTRAFEYKYDKDNNLIEFLPPDEPSISYEYDALDRLARAEDIRFERDAYGAIVVETSKESRLCRVRDELGRPNVLRIDDYRVEWSWEAGRVADIEHGKNFWSVQYDLRGNPIIRTLQNGSLRQEFDAIGNVVKQIVGCDDKTVYEAFYQYDRGELSEVHDTFSRQTFGTDDLQRLNAWLKNDIGLVQRHFDAAHNIVEEKFHAKELRNDVRSNRTYSAWDPYRDRVVLFEYDDRGFVTRRIDDRDTVFEWSSSGRLVATVVDGERWEYSYDALGRRTKKSGPLGSWTYVWDERRIVKIQGPKESISYVYEPYGVVPIAFVTKGRTWDLLSRPQGITNIAISDKGKPVNLHAHLDPWLRPMGTVTATKCMGFPDQEGFLGSAGQFLDPETGLYYNVFRYYDPLLGKFISPDPTGLVGGLNEYAWVPNPMAFIDPLGLHYVSGGPMPWRPGDNARNNGRPNLTDPDNRFVDVGGRDRVVKKKSENDNGKCMTVVDGVPDSALPADRGFQPGDTPTFISGEGQSPFNTPDPSNNFDVRTDQMGNWCHGEIQALHFLVENDISGATVWVDRPPCPMCAGDLDAILDAHFPGGDGRSVTVMYFDQEAGWETWDEYKKRTKPPCGG